MKKKSILLVMCIMIICSYNLIVLAAENVWNGKVATEFAGGSGTESDPYQIKTADQLAYLAQTTNAGEYGYSTKYFSLMNDIDLNNIEWTPIGGSTKKFRGVFNGNNHNIRNLRISEDKFDSLALVEGDDTRYIWIGLFGDARFGTIENLDVTGMITINHNDEIHNDTIYAAGIAGRIGKIVNCNNYVDVSATSTATNSVVYSGGLSGDYVDHANVCNNFGYIYSCAQYHAGSAGISGRGVYDDEFGIKNSGNFGEIKAESPLTSRAAGIAEGITYSSVENCFNKGNICASQAGGIATYIKKSILYNCYNSGNVISDDNCDDCGQLAYRITTSYIDNCFITKKPFYDTIDESTLKNIGCVISVDSAVVFEEDHDYTENVTLLQALNSWVKNNNGKGFKKWIQQDGEYPILLIEEETEKRIFTTTKIINNLFMVTPTGVEKGNIIIFACYNGNKMVYVNPYVYAGETTIPFTTTETYDKVKIFVWENLETCVPLCESEDVPLN